MKRFELYLTEVELKKIKKESDSLDLSMAEIIRRILDSHFETNENLQV